MEYIITSGASVEELTKEVNDNLEEGYNLQGGVCVINLGFPLKYCYQAMVKPDRDCNNCGSNMGTLKECTYCGCHIY